MMAADDYNDSGMDDYEASEEGETFVNDDDDSAIWDLTGIFHADEKAVPVVLPEDVAEDRRKNVGDRRQSPFGDRRQGDRRRLSRSPLQNGTYSIDPMNIYLREMGSLTLLSHEEELKLARMMEEGKFRIQTAALSTQLAFPVLQQLAADLSSGKETLVRANLRLVISVSKKFMNRGMQLPDLIQEGNIGLMKAVEKYDYKRGFKFSTYATWWIRQAVTRGIADQGRTIRLPVHMIETINRMLRFAKDFQRIESREPTPDEMAAQLGTEVEKVRIALKTAKDAISLDAPVNDEEDTMLSDFIENHAHPDPQDNSITESLKRCLCKVMGSLTPREEKVLRMRYGIEISCDHTLEEVGQCFAVTRERIRQIEAQALKKLRHPARSQELQAFMTD
jgi:RNA polymerase sigma factor (sigma-70 family)